MIGLFYGQEGFRHLINSIRGVESGQPDNAALLQHFEQAVRATYPLEGNEDPLNFFEDHLTHANETVNYVIGKVFPAEAAHIGLRDPVSFFSSDPVPYLNSLSDGRDPIKQFEYIRLLNVAHVNALIHPRSRARIVREKLGQISQLQEEHFFDPQYPGTETIYALGTHDIDTNALTSELLFTKQPIAPLGHEDDNLKIHKFAARWEPTVGCMAAQTARIKGHAEAAVKALAEAMSEGGRVDSDKAIRDFYGQLFVIMGSGATRDLFMERYADFIEQSYPGASLDEDHSIGNGRGQSKKMKFKRLQIGLPGMPVKMETMFQTAEEYITGKQELGTPDPATGFLNGPCHDVYELRRLETVVKQCIFPQSIYPQLTDEYVHEQILKQMNNKAEEARLSSEYDYSRRK